MGIFKFSLAVAAIQRRAVPSGVPSFAVDYGENFQPSDLSVQLTHTTPKINFTAIPDITSPLTLDNLNSLNTASGSTNGTNVYLTSNDYIDIPDTVPSWLLGVKPDSTGKSGSAISCAVIVNEQANYTDVFYFYFYAYNWGGFFLGTNLDDHVGDWEHNVVRFDASGNPSQMWFSQHSNGEAFDYAGLELSSGGRAYTYVANGSHANYATTGEHDHTLQIVNLPGEGFLTDYCDNGTVWDPTLSAYWFKYDQTSNTVSAYDDSTPVNWLYFAGGWGDQQYPNSDPRQDNYLDLSIEYKYTSGPTGPFFKQLNRGASQICPANGYPCIVYPTARAK